MRILNKQEWPAQIPLNGWWHDDSRLTWCYEQFGYKNVTYTLHHICFRRPEDATFYAIRWSEVA